MKLGEIRALRREEVSRMLDQEKVDEELSKAIYNYWSRGKNPLIDAQLAHTEEVRALGFLPEEGNEQDCLWVKFVYRANNILCVNPLDTINCESVKGILDLMYTKEERRDLLRHLNMVRFMMKNYTLQQAKRIYQNE